MAALRESITAQRTDTTLELGSVRALSNMVQEPEFIRPDDPDLQRALALHSLKFKQ